MHKLTKGARISPTYWLSASLRAYVQSLDYPDCGCDRPCCEPCEKFGEYEDHFEQWSIKEVIESVIENRVSPLVITS